MISNCCLFILDMELNSQPELKIIDQPIDKYRFRYMSEWMGTHGSLGSTNTRKKQGPTVKVLTPCQSTANTF